MDITQLKQIADGLRALGKPYTPKGRPTAADIRNAKERLRLMEQFEGLVSIATPSERHDLVTVLRDMLNNVTA